MEYKMIAYYLVFGVSVSILMNAIYPLDRRLLPLSIMLWPIMLIVTAFVILLSDVMSEDY